MSKQNILGCLSIISLSSLFELRACTNYVTLIERWRIYIILTRLEGYIGNIDQAQIILPRVEDKGNMVLARSICLMYPERSPVNIIIITYFIFKKIFFFFFLRVEHRSISPSVFVKWSTGKTRKKATSQMFPPPVGDS